jgi:hypothetical protein
LKWCGSRNSCLLEGCKSVTAKLAACSRDVKVWQQNWLLVKRGVAAELGYTRRAFGCEFP